jgi:hypothetical protein
MGDGRLLVVGLKSETTGKSDEEDVHGALSLCAATRRNSKKATDSFYVVLYSVLAPAAGARFDSIRVE